MNSNLHNELRRKLKNLSSIFNFDKILSVKTDTKSIARYYKVNKIPYTLFHDRFDFVHMGISRNGKFKRDDLLEHARLVEKYIKKVNATKVLELATGRGATSAFLAKNYPAISFCGLDLPNGQLDLAKKKANNLNNFQVFEGDYHNLSRFRDNSFDIIFIIEALCYSNNKDKVLEEIKRKLRNKGVLILFDGYSGKFPSKMNKDELLAKRLIEKGMWVPEFENFKTFESMLNKNGFKIIFKEDASFLILPTLKRFEKQARIFLSLPKLISRFLVSICPPEFTHNAVSGYLMPIAIKNGISKYMVYVAGKKY